MSPAHPFVVTRRPAPPVQPSGSQIANQKSRIPLSRWPSSRGGGLHNRTGWCDSSTGLHFRGSNVQQPAWLPSKQLVRVQLPIAAPIRAGEAVRVMHALGNGSRVWSRRSRTSVHSCVTLAARPGQHRRLRPIFPAGRDGPSRVSYARCRWFNSISRNQPSSGRKHCSDAAVS